jgi:hypothetical protein
MMSLYSGTRRCTWLRAGIYWNSRPSEIIVNIETKLVALGIAESNFLITEVEVDREDSASVRPAVKYDDVLSTLLTRSPYQAKVRHFF